MWICAKADGQVLWWAASGGELDASRARCTVCDEMARKTRLPRTRYRAVRLSRRWCSISRSWTSSMQGSRTTPTTWKQTAPGQPLPVADARRPNFGSWSPTREAGMAAKGCQWQASRQASSANVVTLPQELTVQQRLGRGLVQAAASLRSSIAQLSPRP